MYYGDAVGDENYLRGVQEADDDGVVEFTTIFPACYPDAGRTSTSRCTRAWPRPPAPSKLRTSQIAMPQDVCEEVYGEAEGYEQIGLEPRPGEPRHRHGVRRRLLAADGQGDGLARRRLHHRAERARSDRATGGGACEAGGMTETSRRPAPCRPSCVGRDPTGANGFVGSRICAALVDRGAAVRASYGVPAPPRRSPESRSGWVTSTTPTSPRPWSEAPVPSSRPSTRWGRTARPSTGSPSRARR